MGPQGGLGSSRAGRDGWHGLRSLPAVMGALVSLLVGVMVAFGATPATAAGGSPVSTCDQLKAAFASGGAVQLVADVGPCGSITAASGVNVTLSLAGHTLTIVGDPGAAGANAYIVDSDFGVTTSGPGGAGAAGSAGIQVSTGASLNVVDTGTLNVAGGAGGRGGAGVRGGWYQKLNIAYLYVVNLPGTAGGKGGTGAPGIHTAGTLSVSSATVNLNGGVGGAGGNGGPGESCGCLYAEELGGANGGASGDGGAGAPGIAGDGTLTMSDATVNASGAAGGIGGAGGSGGGSSGSHGYGGVGGRGGVGGAGAAGIEGLHVLARSGGRLAASGGPGGSGGVGGAGGSSLSEKSGDGGDGGAGGVAGSGVGGGAVLDAQDGSVEMKGAQGGVGGAGGWGGPWGNISGSGGDGGKGGDGGSGLGFATGTVRGGTVAMAGGNGAAGGTSGPAGPINISSSGYGSWGQPGMVGATGPEINAAGTLALEEAGVWTVPSGSSLANDGTINLGGGGLIDALGTLAGSGTVHNLGTLRVAAGGAVGSGLTVTGHNYALSYSSAHGTVSPSSLRMYAGSLSDAGLSLPVLTGLPTGYTLGSWVGSGGALDQIAVDEKTDLSAGGKVVATAESGPVAIAFRAAFGQTIDFTSTPPSEVSVDEGDYVVSATGGGSGNPVVFSVDDTSTGCSIEGNTVSFIGAGTCVVNANQAGDGTYAAAPQVQQSIVIGKAAQAINFTSTMPSEAAVGGASYKVSATGGGSGNPVVFRLDAASTGCVLDGATVSFTGVGTCVIDANQAGDADYLAAPQVQQSIVIGKAAQAVNFTSAPPSDVAVGDVYVVNATGGASGNPVTFSLDDISAGCAINGATVSFAGPGTCVVNADQKGNDNYTPAPQVQQSIVIGKAAQAINFTSTIPSGVAVGDPAYTVTARGGASDKPVTFALDGSSSGCVLDGAKISFTGVGTCVVNANQTGDDIYSAAPQVQQAMVIGKGAQAIKFTSTMPPGVAVGDPSYTATATGGRSGNRVAFSLDDVSTGCAIDGAKVSFTGVGTCVINANQAGDANYTAAPQVQQSISIAKGLQAIDFISTIPAGVTVGDQPYTVTATGGGSGNPVVFNLDDDSAGCELSDAVVRFVGVGTCLINANQDGNAIYAAAPQVQQAISIARATGAGTPNDHKPPTHQPPRHQPPTHKPPRHQPPTRGPSVASTPAQGQFVAASSVGATINDQAATKSTSKPPAPASPSATPTQSPSAAPDPVQAAKPVSAPEAADNDGPATPLLLLGLGIGLALLLLLFGAKLRSR